MIAYHPLLESVDALNDEQLGEKIRDLTKKYFLAQSTYMKDEINNILDIYVAEQTKRLEAQEQSTNEFDDLIDVN